MKENYGVTIDKRTGNLTISREGNEIFSHRLSFESSARGIYEHVARREDFYEGNSALFREIKEKVSSFKRDPSNKKILVVTREWEGG